IVNGGPLGNGTLNLGGSNNLQVGGVNVPGVNSVIRLEGGVNVDIGVSGSVQVANSNAMGELQIADGSILTARRGGVIGRVNEAHGLVSISGTGSAWNLIGAS